jgi:hypothetical protein
MEAERHTYAEWKRLKRQVRRGARSGPDGCFGFAQTKGMGTARAPRRCKSCGGKINYGVYCGKCEYR